jgi:hypothetical protein
MPFNYLTIFVKPAANIAVKIHPDSMRRSSPARVARTLAGLRLWNRGCQRITALRWPTRRWVFPFQRGQRHRPRTDRAHSRSAGVWRLPAIGGDGELAMLTAAFTSRSNISPQVVQVNVRSDRASVALAVPDNLGDGAPPKTPGYGRQRVPEPGQYASSARSPSVASRRPPTVARRHPNWPGSPGRRGATASPLGPLATKALHGQREPRPADQTGAVRVFSKKWVANGLSLYRAVRR